MISFINEDVMPSTEELSGVANEDLFASGKLGMDRDRHLDVRRLQGRPLPVGYSD